MSVEVQPKDRSQLPDSRSTIKTRDLKPSNRLAIRTYLQEVDAYTLVGNVHGCAEKVSIFQSIIQHGLDSVLPLRSKAIHSRDPPWINSGLKDLIRRRQRALAEIISRCLDFCGTEWTVSVRSAGGGTTTPKLASLRSANRLLGGMELRNWAARHRPLGTRKSYEIITTHKEEVSQCLGPGQPDQWYLPLPNARLYTVIYWIFPAVARPLHRATIFLFYACCLPSACVDQT